MTSIRRLAAVLALAVGAAAPAAVPALAEDAAAPAPAAAASSAEAAPAEAGAAASPAWSQQENIVEAAKHIALVQRKQGAQKAVDFIDACYRTHSLASTYTRAFEACIARDYILSQALAGLYAQIPPEELKKRGAPSPASLTRAMGQRVAAAFKQYDVSPELAESFRVLVEKEGFPVFMAIAFPPAKDDGAKGKGNAGPAKGNGKATGER